MGDAPVRDDCLLFFPCLSLYQDHSVNDIIHASISSWKRYPDYHLTAWIIISNMFPNDHIASFKQSICYTCCPSLFSSCWRPNIILWADDAVMYSTICASLQHGLQSHKKLAPIPIKLGTSRETTLPSSASTLVPPGISSYKKGAFPFHPHFNVKVLLKHLIANVQDDPSQVIPHFGPPVPHWFTIQIHKPLWNITSLAITLLICKPLAQPEGLV